MTECPDSQTPFRANCRTLSLSLVANLCCWLLCHPFRRAYPTSVTSIFPGFCNHHNHHDGDDVRSRSSKAGRRRYRQLAPPFRPSWQLLTDSSAAHKQLEYWNSVDATPNGPLASSPSPARSGRITGGTKQECWAASSSSAEPTSRAAKTSLPGSSCPAALPLFGLPTAVLGLTPSHLPTARRGLLEPASRMGGD